MAIRQPLARRIVIAFSSLTLVIGGLFSLAVVGVVLWVEQDIVSASMSQQMTLVLDAYRESGQLPEVGADTRFYAPGLTAPAQQGMGEVPDGFTELVTPTGAFYVFRRTVNGQPFILVRDQDEFEAQEHILFGGVFAGLVASVLLAWAMGHLTASRVMTPVIELARRVRTRQRSPGPSPRLAPDFADDEVGQLASAFDAALGELHAALERERLFTSDVSHELRTPLMIIASAGELLAARLPGPREQALVAGIRRAAEEMHELVQAFMLLARAQANKPVDAEGVGLAQVAREQAERWGPTARDKGLDFVLHIDGDPAGRYSPTFLRVVMGNLLRNALHHTERGAIHLRVDASGFVVDDTGSGIPEELKATVFDAFVQGQAAGSEGMGLGLSLVWRVCAASGWAVTLADRPEGGTRARVTLSPAH